MEERSLYKRIPLQRVGKQIMHCIQKLLVIFVLSFVLGCGEQPEAPKRDTWEFGFASLEEADLVANNIKAIGKQVTRESKGDLHYLVWKDKDDREVRPVICNSVKWPPPVGHTSKLDKFISD